MLKILFIELFFQPKRFFRERISFCKKNYLWLTYLVGVGFYIDKLDRLFLQATIAGGKKLELLSKMPWSIYWILTLVLGTMSAVLVWWINGWWYKIRIKWSGCKQPDPFESRLVFVASHFVHIVPVIVVTILSSFLFKTPLEAYIGESNSPYIEIIDFFDNMLLLLFIAWSIFVSYKGVITRFDVVKWKAKLWFVVFPSLFFIAILLVAVFYYMVKM